jgi:alpha-tubulin suppressor-like RCC1 family protein
MKQLIIKSITIAIVIITCNSNLKAQCWKFVRTDENRSIAIKTDSSLWSWGANADGQLGDGTTTDKNTPVQIATGSTWKYADIHRKHSIGIKTNGTLWVWGKDDVGNILGINSSVPTQIGTTSNWEKVATGWYHALAINSNGELFSWGTGQSGELGQGTLGTSSSIGITQITNPVLSTGETWVDIACGDAHSFALTSSGKLYAFGFNQYGQLGIGNNSNTNIPTCINCGTSDPVVSKISAGKLHTLYIDNIGGLYATGRNDKGQIGDSTNIDKNTFVKLLYPERWIDVEAGFSQTHAIASGNRLFAWGLNNFTSGYGLSPSDTNMPIPIGIRNCISVSCGGTFTQILKNDNSIFSCGYYSNGARGDGINGNTSVFGQVGTACNALDTGTSICNVLYDNFNTNMYGNWSPQNLPLTHAVGWTVSLYGQHIVLKGLLANNFQYISQTNLNINNNGFKATFDVYNGKDAVLLSLNSQPNPFFSDAISSGGGSPGTTTPMALTNAILDGIAVTTESDTINGVYQRYFKLYAKDNGIISTAPNRIFYSTYVGTTHFLVLERKNLTTVELKVYSDAAHTILYGTSGVFTIPSTIEGLNSAVISSLEWRPSGNSGYGDLDNICISNVFPLALNSASENTSNIYPNPASNNISINSKNEIQKIVIYDLQGNLVTKVEKDFQKIDISKLNSGIYFVTIHTNIGIESSRFLVQK